MTINVLIISGQALGAFYVGDYFTYDIQLQNNDTATISAVFTVEIFNVTHHLVKPVRSYTRSLQPGEKTNLFPNQTASASKKQYDIFFFDSQGTYEIDVVSSVPIAFYEYFANGKYIFQHTTFRYYFDALPASEQALDLRVENWIQQSQQNAVENSAMAKYMFRLTVVMYFVTVVNAGLVVWAVRAQQSRRVSLGLYVYLCVLIGLLLLIVFEVPVPLLRGSAVP